MMKKLCIIPVLLSVLLGMACVPDGEPHKDSGETNNYFYTKIDPLGGGFVVEGATVTDYPMTDVTFINESIQEGSDIFLNEYDLRFVRPEKCSVAQCPPLTSITGMAFWTMVPAGGENTIVDVPMANYATYVEFYSNSIGGIPEVYYKVIATFYGENEFGYPVKTKAEYILIFSNP